MFCCIASIGHLANSHNRPIWVSATYISAAALFYIEAFLSKNHANQSTRKEWYISSVSLWLQRLVALSTCIIKLNS